MQGLRCRLFLLPSPPVPKEPKPKSPKSRYAGYILMISLFTSWYFSTFSLSFSSSLESLGIAMSTIKQFLSSLLMITIYLLLLLLLLLLLVLYLYQLIRIFFSSAERLWSALAGKPSADVLCIRKSSTSPSSQSI